MWNCVNEVICNRRADFHEIASDVGKKRNQIVIDIAKAFTVELNETLSCLNQ